MKFAHNLNYKNWHKLKGSIMNTDGAAELTTSENHNSFTFPLFFFEYKWKSGAGYRQLSIAMDAAVMQAERIGLPSPYVFFSADVDVQHSNIMYLAMEYRYEKARMTPFIIIVLRLCFFGLGQAEDKKISLHFAAV